MASEQAKRDNVVKEREVEVEKERVPKIASHFESIAEKSKDSPESQHEGESGGSNIPVVSSGGGKEGTTGKKEEEGKASLEDIQGYRANAQQKSMDTIRAAEERYNKAKDSLNRGGQERETGVHGFQGEKAQHAQLLAAGGAEFKEREGQESGGGRPGGRSATDTLSEKAREAKESVGQGAQKAAEMGREKGEAVKDTASEKGEEAKETMVEGGKGVAHYAGVAADKAAVAGWTAAHYTTEKVVQGTKVVAGTVEEVVEDAVDLTKEKAAAAADTVLEYTARKRDEAQHKNQEMQQGGEEEKRQGVDTGPKRGLQEKRQEGVNTEPKRGFEEKRQGGDTEPKRDFGEKRQGVDTEPKRGFEVKRQGVNTEPKRGEEEKHGEEKGSERDVSGEQRKAHGEETRGGRGSEENVLGYGTKGMVGEEGAESGGVLEAIGETIVEIAQNTKNIVIGDNTPERNT